MRTWGISRRQCAGASLVEIMVGIVVGMLAILIMLQQLSVFEGQKRTTTGGADAQNRGAIMLYGLQRDIRQAGYGVTWPTLFTCNMALLSGGNVPVAPVVINPPTTVIPAGDANTDTLLVIYGSADTEPQGNVISAQVGTTHTVQLPNSFTVGDIVMAAPDSCSTDLLPRPVTAIAASTITAATGTGSTMYNLGSAPVVLAYAIRNGNLTVCDYIATNCGTAKASLTAAAWAARWVSIASNIVSLRAQYGADTSTPMDGVVDAYNQSTPTTSCGWSKISAVRLAIVARNSQYNKSNADGTDVTSSAPAWVGSSGAPIVLSGDANWNHYRYKVFQTVIPMRNLTWLGVQAGC